MKATAKPFVPGKTKGPKGDRAKIGQEAGALAKDAEKLVKLIDKEWETDGELKQPVVDRPKVDTVEENPKFNNELGSHLNAMLMSYVLSQVGSGDIYTFMQTFNWGANAALLNNEARRAARGDKLKVEKYPRQIRYAFECIRKKAGLIRKGKSVTYAFSDIAPDAPDGTNNTVGMFNVGTFLATGAGTGNQVTFSVPGTVSMLGRGGFAEQLVVATFVFNEADAVTALGKLFAMCPDLRLEDSSYHSWGKQDSRTCADAFGKNTNPAWSVSSPSWGFQTEVTVNAFPRDVRILQLYAAYPETSATPDTRKGVMTVVGSGGPMVGWFSLFDRHSETTSGAKVFTRPVPYRFGDILELVLRVFAQQLLDTKGDLLTGMASDFMNTLELVTVIYNMVINVFKGQSPFAGDVFPQHFGTANERGTFVGTQNYPNTASAVTAMAAAIVDRFREMNNYPIANYPTVKGCSIVRKLVLTTQPNINYVDGVRAILVGRGLDAARVAVVFPDAPVIPTVDRLWGVVCFTTCQWAANTASAAVDYINVTKGGIIQVIQEKWNALQGQLAAAGMISSGLMNEDATTNRHLVVLKAASDDQPITPFNGIPEEITAIVGEHSLAEWAADQRVGTREPFLYFIDSINPVVVAGVIGGVAYNLENLTVAFGMPCTNDCGQTNWTLFCKDKVSQLQPTPMRGVASSDLTLSTKERIVASTGGGLRFSADKLDTLKGLIDGPPERVDQIVRALRDHGFANAAVAHVLSQKNVRDAVEKLKVMSAKRENWNKFIDFLMDAMKRVFDAAKS